MGNLICSKGQEDPDSAWREQNRASETNPAYRFANLQRGGTLIDAYRKGGPSAVKEIAKKEMLPYLCNGGKGAMISKVDYIRWKQRWQAKRMGTTVLDTKTDEELLSEYQEDEYNKILDHEICWDLDQRAAVGETPLHLLYLMDSAEHTEVAKILLSVYPKLALDFYEDDEYFGESSLHLAVVYNDFESVKLLVSNGANVNQRASGRFFLPEDQKKGNFKRSSTDYDGFAYYGEYPLAFAACFGHMEIYDYLIDHGADPDMQDSFGNTALHMVVVADKPEMYKYMVKHHKKPASVDIVNKENLSPLTLASKLGRQKIFKEMLEIGSIEWWRYSNVICSAYPITTIDSIGPTGDTNWNSALMILLNGEEDGHLDMLEGGVIGQLLSDKWKTFARRRFFERLILTLLHLSLISVAVYLRPVDGLVNYTEPKDGIRFCAEILVCLFCIGILILEAVEIGSQGVLGFVRNCRHAPAQTIFMFSCLLILLCIPFRFLKLQMVEDVLLILAVPGAWFYLLFFARSVPLTGPFVTMIYKMLVGDWFRFSVIYFIFLISFTQGFYFLFRDINQESFSSLPNTILTLFQMTLGEFKYHDFDLTRYAVLTKLVFAVFMILVPILLLNMLIAMMGNTYQTVISKSEKEWRKQWAKIVVVLERGFSKKKLLHYQREYSVKLGGGAEEIRALVVIKTSSKTKARQRKVAISNWKKLGREVVMQLKEQKAQGRVGHFKLHKSRRLRRKPSEGGGGHSESEDEALKISEITEQLAWERDIDLTKGQSFLSQLQLADKDSDKKSIQNPFKLVKTEQSSPIPNGKPRTIKRYVKKPNGTPKTSPKVQKHQFSYNRVSPLPLSKQSSPSDESDFDQTKRVSLSSQQDYGVQEESVPDGQGQDLKYESILETKAVLEDVEEEENKGSSTQMKEPPPLLKDNPTLQSIQSASGVMVHLGDQAGSETGTDPHTFVTVDSRTRASSINEWVREPAEIPEEEEERPTSSRHKHKKDKKEKKRKKHERRKEKEKEKERLKESMPESNSQTNLLLNEADGKRPEEEESEL